MHTAKEKGEGSISSGSIVGFSSRPDGLPEEGGETVLGLVASWAKCFYVGLDPPVGAEVYLLFQERSRSEQEVGQGARGERRWQGGTRGDSAVGEGQEGTEGGVKALRLSVAKHLTKVNMVTTWRPFVCLSLYPLDRSAQRKES